MKQLIYSWLCLLFLCLATVSSQQFPHPLPGIPRRRKHASLNVASLSPVSGTLNPRRQSFPPTNPRGLSLDHSNNPITFGNSPVRAPATRRKAFRTLQSPSCSEDSNIPCEWDNEYDNEVQERIDYLIRSTRLNGILQDNTISQLLNDSSIVSEKVLGDDRVSTRFSGFITESPACSATESIIYPKRAKTPKDDWVFVLNQGSVRQGVRVEKCSREGEPCSQQLGSAPNVRTICRQKFIYRKVLVLSGQGTDIQPESILIPSCCVCYISRSKIQD